MKLKSRVQCLYWFWLDSDWPITHTASSGPLWKWAHASSKVGAWPRLRLRGIHNIFSDRFGFQRLGSSCVEPFCTSGIICGRPNFTWLEGWGGAVWIIWISPLRMAQFHHSLEPNCPQCSNYQVNSTSFHHEACLKSLYRKTKSNQSMDVAK